MNVVSILLMPVVSCLGIICTVCEARRMVAELRIPFDVATERLGEVGSGDLAQPVY
jgi:hypothetical protein